MLDLKNIKTCTVGTLNPTKIDATRDVLLSLGSTPEIVSIKAPSGVSDMPSTEKETELGAWNRAKYCMHHEKTDIGVGLEGGISFEQAPRGEELYFLYGCAVVIDSDGFTSVGRGSKFLLPPSVADQLKEGKELGPLMDIIIGDHNTKQKGGAVGYFTKGLIPRKKSFENILLGALVPWLHVDLYVQ